MEPISCFPKGFCAHTMVRDPRGGSSGGLGLHSELTSNRSRCEPLLICTVPEEAGGREGSLDWIAGQVTTCLFFLLYLS